MNGKKKNPLFWEDAAMQLGFLEPSQPPKFEWEKIPQSAEVAESSLLGTQKKLPSAIVPLYPHPEHVLLEENRIDPKGSCLHINTYN